jgi:hypothetical protein
MKITVAKRNGLEEVHAAGCRDLKNRRGRGWDSDREDWTLEVANLGELYANYWTCIDDESVGEGDYPTKEHAHWAWRGEFKVLPCVGDLPEMDEPGTASPEPAKITAREAKADLAKRLLLAAETVLESADGSEAFLAAMSPDEARETIDFWLRRTLPRGVFES